MKILTLDLESSPNLAYTWGLFKQTIAIGQIAAPGEVIGFAAKWLDSNKVEWRSVHHDGKDVMLERAHALLSEADVVVTFNGRRFDIPYLNAEFLTAGMQPPAPVQQVDLYQVAKKHFRFPSFKLDYVSRAVGLGGKVKHTGFQLWVDCLKGDDKAWALMRRYCIGDVRLTEELYLKLLPWVSSHPSVSLTDDTDVPTCQCGSTALQRRGFSFTALGKYQRWQCTACGAWHRSSKRLNGADLRGVSS